MATILLRNLADDPHPLLPALSWNSGFAEVVGLDQLTEFRTSSLPSR